MRKLILSAMAAASLAAFAALATAGSRLKAPAQAPRAPAFTHAAADEWLNSGPLTLAALEGQVVLVEFWTFDCWNCYRTIPWLNQLYDKYRPRGLQLVSVHTPEFDHEKVAANVERKLAEFKVRYPVMLDNDYSYWRAFANQYWPAFYLVDRQGRLRASWAGETHPGDRQARLIEADIEALLAE